MPNPHPVMTTVAKTPPARSAQQRDGVPGDSQLAPCSLEKHNLDSRARILVTAGAGAKVSGHMKFGSWLLKIALGQFEVTQEKRAESENAC